MSMPSQGCTEMIPRSRFAYRSTDLTQVRRSWAVFGVVSWVSKKALNASPCSRVSSQGSLSRYCSQMAIARLRAATESSERERAIFQRSKTWCRGSESPKIGCNSDSLRPRSQTLPPAPLMAEPTRQGPQLA